MKDARQQYLTHFAEHRGGKEWFPAPKEGDLILLQHATLDNCYDKKLEARWEGPFCLGDLAHHGRSGCLYDITTGALVKTKTSGLKDRIHQDDLKVNVLPAEQWSKEGEAGGVLECVRMGWKGGGAVGWESVGFGGGVDLHTVILEEVFLCSLE